VADLAETLKSVPLFAGLPEKDLRRLADRMSTRTVPEGQEITAEGKSGIGFFVIEDGTATVSIGGDTVRTLGAGDYFGEIALIDGGPRSATIVAESDLSCSGMTAWEFRPLVQENPTLAWSLLEALVARLRESQQRPG
jgi:CRP-like cAMP-binding protein